jgi:hypothetical protein
MTSVQMVAQGPPLKTAKPLKRGKFTVDRSIHRGIGSNRYFLR